MLLDYKQIGLKCGLEIHQQLDTEKLFCSCPTLLRDDPPDFAVKRRLRAVAGERGEIDVAALHEQLKGKQFAYEGYKDTTCLVEMDEEPPHPLNQEALKVALETALLLNARVVDVIQVMRKTVIDGSNTSGFQRTALVGYGGRVGTKDGEVSVQTLCLEEDSARIVREENDAVVYRLDRLGVPLIEIGTGPDITSPQQCLETAEKLGMILRSTGKVKRGIGTIRQDVNVSVRGGARVEIKGAQELKLLPTLVEYEALRQLNLLEIKKELEKRKNRLKKEVVDVSDVFAQTQSKIIKGTLTNGGIVLGQVLSGFGGLIGKEVQPGRRLGTEFSERAKVKARVGGIFHSDELPAYGITEDDVGKIKEKLRCKGSDGFVLVAAAREKAMIAMDAVFERAQEAMSGVPGEVRRANPDGATSYLRPMPGAARMYPETDIPLIEPDVKGITLPELIEQKVERYVKRLGLGFDLAEQVATSERGSLFEEMVKKYPDIKPAFVAEVLTAKMTELRRDYHVKPEKIREGDLRQVFDLLSKGKIHKDVVLDVLIDMAKGTFNLNYYKGLGTEELHKELGGIVQENPGAPFSALMGIAVKKLKSKASGQKISEMLAELMKGHASMKEEKKISSALK